MQLGTSDKRLEGFRIFPYISWGLVIIFSIFVYNITKKLTEVSAHLDEQTQYLEDQVKGTGNEIKASEPQPKKK